MPSNFNSNFGGVGQEPNPHAIQIPKKQGDFNATFTGKGQDISRHSIPPMGRIGADLSNNTPIRGNPFGAVPTAQFVTPQGGGNVTVYPFTCRISGTNLTLTPGTVNSLLPSNMTSTFVIPSTGTRYVNLVVYASNAEITNVSISVDYSPPPAVSVSLGQPPTTFYINIAVIIDKTAYRTIGGGSLTATSYEVYRLAKSLTSPDSIPYDSYYSWRLGLA